MSKPVLAFFGYARAADDATDGAIGELHAVLQARVRARSGRRDFELWRDNLSIRWGQAWEQRLHGAIDEALFYVPVITPDFFESEWCCKEANAFLDRIAAGDSRTRVLPLYVLDDTRFDRPGMRIRSAIRARIHAHQFRDLRRYLNEDWRRGEALNAVDALAKEIAERIVEIEHEEETIRAVGPLLAKGDLTEAELELRESEFTVEADGVAAIALALRKEDWDGARALVAAARRGLLGERWAVSEQWIGSAESAALARRQAAERLAREAAAREAVAEAARRVPGAVRHIALATSAPLQMVYVPAGTFEMGSPAGVGDFDEHPQHRVRIGRDFLVAATPVTQAQWRTVARTVGLPEAPSPFTGEALPVTAVSWQDAVRWCNALSASERRPLAYQVVQDRPLVVKVDLSVGGYRLPTEAEWEYACRAGTSTRWNFGDDPQAGAHHAAWNRALTSAPPPVATGRPNAWGLFDVHGMVWEWTNDHFRRVYQAREELDPLTAGPESGIRMTRGGGWTAQPMRCRSAYRSAAPTTGEMVTGFRPILPLPPDP